MIAEHEELLWNYFTDLDAVFTKLLFIKDDGVFNFSN